MRRRLRRPQPGPAAARGAAAPAAAAAGGADDDDAAVIRAKRSWWLCDFCEQMSRPGWYCMRCGDTKVKGLASPKCADGPQGDFLAADSGLPEGGMALGDGTESASDSEQPTDQGGGELSGSSAEEESTSSSEPRARRRRVARAAAAPAAASSGRRPRTPPAAAAAAPRGTPASERRGGRRPAAPAERGGPGAGPAVQCPPAPPAPAAPAAPAWAQKRLCVIPVQELARARADIPQQELQGLGLVRTRWLQASDSAKLWPVAPLVATGHVAIRLSAERNEVEVHVKPIFFADPILPLGYRLPLQHLMSYAVDLTQQGQVAEHHSPTWLKTGSEPYRHYCTPVQPEGPFQGLEKDLLPCTICCMPGGFNTALARAAAAEPGGGTERPRQYSRWVNYDFAHDMNNCLLERFPARQKWLSGAPLGGLRLWNKLDVGRVLLAAKPTLHYSEPADSPGIRVKLRAYQQDAVAWWGMRERAQALVPSVEVDLGDGVTAHYNDVTGALSLHGPCGLHGGILASDMGMGKTVMTLASCAKHGFRACIPDDPRTVRGHRPGGTLILVPPILVSQWKHEIPRICQRASVCVYHGPGRPRDAAAIASFDVVLASYNTATGPRERKRTSMLWGRANEHDESGPKTGSPLEAIQWHRIVCDEAHLCNEFLGMSVCDFHATNRWLLSGTPFCAYQWAAFDRISGVLTALYGTQMRHPLAKANTDQATELVSQCMLRHEKKDKYVGGVHPLLLLPPKHERIIAFPLSTHERWVYNRTKDLLREKRRSRWFKQSLAERRLLHMASHCRNVRGDFLCSEVELLDWRHRARAAVGAGGWGMVGSAQDQRSRFRSVTLGELEQELRRKGCAGGLLRTLMEQDYWGLPQDCIICHETLQMGTDQHPCCVSCGHIFCRGCLIALLAQPAARCPVCSSQFLDSEVYAIRANRDVEGAAADAAGGRPRGAAAAAGAVDSDSDASEGAAPAPAAAGACRGSAGSSRTGSKRKRAAAPAPDAEPDFGPRPSQDDLRAWHILFNRLREHPLSSKVREVFRQYTAVRDDAGSDDYCPDAKFLWFTMYDGTRRVLAAELERRGIRHLELRCGDSLSAQRRVLEEFTQDPEVVVLLLGFQVGAVGLNLTTANHIFVLDTPNNLTLERQAVGRCHRMGQGREVHVRRFVATGTWDEILAAVAQRESAGQEVVTGGMSRMTADVYAPPNAAAAAPAAPAQL